MEYETFMTHSSVNEKDRWSEWAMFAVNDTVVVFPLLSILEVLIYCFYWNVGLRVRVYVDDDNRVVHSV